MRRASVQRQWLGAYRWPAAGPQPARGRAPTHSCWAASVPQAAAPQPPGAPWCVQPPMMGVVTTLREPLRASAAAHPVVGRPAAARSIVLHCRMVVVLLSPARHCPAPAPPVRVRRQRPSAMATLCALAGHRWPVFLLPRQRSPWLTRAHGALAVVMAARRRPPPTPACAACQKRIRTHGVEWTPRRQRCD